jgi:hypothetical protein
MSPLQWIMVVDAVALIAVTIAGGITEARAARARYRITDSDWALLASWLAGEAASQRDVIDLNGGARTLVAAPGHLDMPTVRDGWRGRLARTMLRLPGNVVSLVRVRPRRDAHSCSSRNGDREQGRRAG